ncbi:helix-turn-helix domain-containing protein [Paracoccus versutus]
MAMHPITQRIKALMDERGMSKADLSHAADIPYHRLNPWFFRDNAKPNADDIEAVATALSVKASFLITGEDDGPREEASWILSVYDNLPRDKQMQLEGFARFLAEEAKRSQGSGQEPEEHPKGEDPDS